MFKKLKEKITEEVKSSPQRLQQFTQSVTDKLQSSTASSDNFFSIGEDDSATEPGFTNVSLSSPPFSRPRRTSTSSVASDVSFLPRYEYTTNSYHLQKLVKLANPKGVIKSENGKVILTPKELDQKIEFQTASDLDISASEVEDNASSSSQLGHLSKEQIYSAFQKSQQRYHKYRGRYTDLAKHYSTLEREINKMKVVLVETQDKAIRRVTELKEQCALEQKAKEHLESALRDDIDEKCFKIQTLQMKIELLQGSRETSERTEVGVDLEQLTRTLNEARQEIEILNSRLQEMKASAIVFQSKEQEYKARLADFTEREKENNLILAQNKMELHNELLSKDSEMLHLKQNYEVLRQSLEAYETKGASDKLQVQNKKLVEKLEAYISKCNSYESEILKLEQYKIEIKTLTEANSELRVSLKETEAKLEAVREETKKSILSLEDKISMQFKQEFEAKRVELEAQLTHNETGDLAELQAKLRERDAQLKRFEEDNAKLQFDFESASRKYWALEKDHLDLISDTSMLRHRIAELEKQAGMIRNEAQIKHSRLELKIGDLQYVEAENIRLQSTINELATQLNFASDKAKHLEIITDEDKLAKVKLRELEAEKNALLEESQSKVQEAEDTITSLKNEVQKNEDTAEAMSSHLMLLEEVTTRLHAVETENFQLQAIVVKFEDELKLRETVVSEMKLLTLQLQASEDKNNSLMQNLEDKTRKSADMTAKLVEREAQLNSVQDELCALKDSQTTLQQLTSKLSILKEANADLEIKLQIAADEKNNLLERFDTESSNFEVTKQKLQENQTLVAVLKNELGEKEKLLEETNRNMNETEINNQALHADLVSELKALQVATATAKAETAAAETHVKQLESDAQKATSTLTALNEELYRYKTTSETASAEARLLQAHLSEVEAESIEMHVKLQTSHVDLENAEANIVKLESETRESKLKLLAFENQNSQLISDVAELHRKILEQKLENDTLRKDFHEVNLKLAALQEQNTQLSSQIIHHETTIEGSQAEIADLKVELKELQVKLKASEQKTSQLLRDVAVNQGTESKKDGEIARLQAVIEETNLKREALEREIEEAFRSLKQVYEGKATLLEECKRQKVETTDLVSEIGALKSGFASLEQERTRLLREAKENEAEILKIQNVAEEFRAQLKAIEEEKVTLVKDAEVEIAQLSCEVTELKSKLRAIEDDSSKRLKKIEANQSVAEELRAKLSDADSEAFQLTSEIDDLKSQLNVVVEEKVTLLKHTEEQSLLIANLSTEADTAEALRQFQDKLSAKFEGYSSVIEGRSEVFEQLLRRLLSDKTNDIKRIVSRKNLEGIDAQLQNFEEVFDSERMNLLKLAAALKLQLLQMKDGEAKREIVDEENDRLKVTIVELQERVGDLSSANNSLEISLKRSSDIERRFAELSKEFVEASAERSKFESNVTELELQNLRVQSDNKYLAEENQSLLAQLEDFSIQKEMHQPQCIPSGNVGEPTKLHQQLVELERHLFELENEKQLLLDEIQELKTTPLNLPPSTTQKNSNKLDDLSILKQEADLQEIEVLRDKLSQYKSLDSTNRSSIEFYENELHKIKVQNERLSRNLDETLVTLNHCTELSSSTEIEYLRNVLYNYMLGKESLVLARVIAAVCKFDQKQTDAVLAKEQQKQTLFGHLGIL